MAQAWDLLSTPGIANSDAYKLQTGYSNEWCRVIMFWMHRNILKFQRNRFLLPPFFFSLNTRPLSSVFHFPSFERDMDPEKYFFVLEKQYYTNIMINGRWLQCWEDMVKLLYSSSHSYIHFFRFFKKCKLY